MGHDNFHKKFLHSIGHIYFDLVFVFLDDISHHFINIIMLSNNNGGDVLSFSMHMTLLRHN